LLLLSPSNASEQKYGRLFALLEAPRRPFKNECGRTVALARQNYLFAASDREGESAAAIYRLIGTVKRNGIDPDNAYS
jgi:hypothetical protein